MPVCKNCEKEQILITRENGLCIDCQQFKKAEKHLEDFFSCVEEEGLDREGLHIAWGMYKKILQQHSYEKGLKNNPNFTQRAKAHENSFRMGYQKALEDIETSVLNWGRGAILKIIKEQKIGMNL